MFKENPISSSNLKKKAQYVGRIALSTALAAGLYSGSASAEGPDDFNNEVIIPGTTSHVENPRPINGKVVDAKFKFKLYTPGATSNVLHEESVQPASVPESPPTVILPVETVLVPGCPALISEALGAAGCAVSFCESGWNSNATGSQGEMGWFQVHPRWHADATLDPVGNVAAAVRISEGGTNWGAWSVRSVLSTGRCPNGTIPGL